MFLREHPGWSYRDLEEAPAEVIDLMLMLDHEAAAVSKSRQSSKGFGRG